MSEEINKKEVIYIASDTRSGSTLLDMLLNTDSNSVSVGEMKYFCDFLNRTEKGLEYNAECTCGFKIENCNFWGTVIEGLQKKGNKVTSLCYSHKKFKKNIDKINESDKIRLIYEEIFNQFEYDVIIDSSKTGMYLDVLRRSYSNLKVIYLIRDGRAVSNSKRKRNGTTISLGAYLWFRNNLRIKKVLKWIPDENIMYLKYEDLCSNTDEVIENLKEFTNLSEIQQSKLGSIEKHNLAGSPHRFSQTSKIKKDTSWFNSFNLIDYFQFIVVAGVFQKLNHYNLFKKENN